MSRAINLCHAQKLKLACLVHGGCQEELESLLDFERLGLKEGSEGLEFGGRIVSRVFHVTPRLGSTVLCHDRQEHLTYCLGSSSRTG